MPPDNIHPENFQYHHLMAPVTAIAGQVQLLRRQILRAEGLTNLERDMLLSTLASMSSSVQVLRDHAESMTVPGSHLPPRMPQAASAGVSQGPGFRPQPEDDPTPTGFQQATTDVGPDHRSRWLSR